MDIYDNIKILDEEIEKLSREKMTTSTAQLLNAYYGAKVALEHTGDMLTNKYKNDIIVKRGDTIISNDYFNIQNEHNLKKLCIEIQELCISVYATLRNDSEKNIYMDMIQSIKK